MAKETIDVMHLWAVSISDLNGRQLEQLLEKLNTSPLKDTDSPMINDMISMVLVRKYELGVC